MNTDYDARITAAQLLLEVEALEARARRLVRWCEWCGSPFQGHFGPGRPQIYCSGTHKNACTQSQFRNRNRPIAQDRARPKLVGGRDPREVWLHIYA
jgi:hypothetical protein